MPIWAALGTSFPLFYWPFPSPCRLQGQIQSLNDTSLQAFAFMSGELGRLMATLTLAFRQVWLAQSPLSEPCRRVLHSLLVVPGEMFGPTTQHAPERSSQAAQTRQQFARLRREPIPFARQGAPPGHVGNRLHPPGPGGFQRC